MYKQILLVCCLAAYVVDRSAHAKVCSGNADCTNIPHGSTGVCSGGICMCTSPYYRVSTAGCDLVISPPTLTVDVHNRQLAKGGNYNFTCTPAVTLSTQTSFTYKLMKGSDEIMTSKDKLIFTLKDVESDDAGVYNCLHSFDNLWSPRSNNVAVTIVEAGWVCTRDDECPSKAGYQKSCDKKKSRCECDDDYVAKGAQCVPDGAHSNMAASLAVVLMAAVVSRLF